MSQEANELVSDYLDQQVKAGRLSLPCPRIAATQFLGLLKTDLHMRLLFNQPVSVSRAKLRHIVDCSVQMFLGGCRKR